ncbi:MAG: ATP-binding protein [Cyanobacteria bacterium J06634_6]
MSEKGWGEGLVNWNLVNLFNSHSMGLSISYKIITERHQGSLICESVVGKGTTFLIELPIRANRTA